NGWPPSGSNPGGPPGLYVYNDNDGSTAYAREFTMLLNEVDERPHDLLEAVQEFVWSDYKPTYWLINGRTYPDTVKHGDDPSLEIDGTVRQPISSLVQANPGDRVLLRTANLGYEQHTMQLPGISMKVVGHDAALLRNGTTDLSYYTNNIYIGPGEARDVIFVAPAFDPSAETDTDGVGAFNRYYFRNRNYHKLTNGGAPGLGGMVTEVRIYDDGGGAVVPTQSEPNETFKSPV
ncbi:MAG: hypothetical protein GY803_05325, partial [Chloroflexi bacterium]|nr:hypothetical protein [Chloroflexota bacterium]